MEGYSFTRFNNDVIQIKYNERKIYICVYEDMNEYSSVFTLNFINDKLSGIIKFKTLSNFCDCLYDNINKNSLLIDPPYKDKVIATKWMLFPNENKFTHTFTLMLRRRVNENLSLYFFSNYKDASVIIKEIEEQELFIRRSKGKDNIDNNLEEIIYDQGSIIENIKFFKDINKVDKPKKILFDEMSNDLKLKNKEFRQVLILFYDINKKDDLFETIIDVVNEKYSQHIYLIIINEKETEKINQEFLNTSQELKIELENLINTKLTSIKKEYFDINNIMILNGNEYSKIYICLLKIYSYFNQLGDGFYKELLDYSDFARIKGFEKEFKYLYNYHNFNILLWGESGVGKSSFINAVLGEKRAFTQKSETTGTFQENYYVHKKYPIKLIDSCGFGQKNETEELTCKLKNVYNKSNDNVLIDMDDNFSFSRDKRNLIHLLLYFVIQDSKIDIKPVLASVIETAEEHKIPIIIVVNKCKDEIFENKEEMKDLRNEIEILKSGKNNKKSKVKQYPYAFINCITKNGIDYLFKIIYEKFEKKLVPITDLDKINNHSITKEKLDIIINNSIFFDNKGTNENLLDEALNKSAKDIKTLIVQHVGLYVHKLKFWNNLAFKWYNFRLYNYLYRNNSNFFPLLTKLVETLFKNFDIKKSANFNINGRIKKSIFTYFNIKEEKKERELKNEIKIELQNDIKIESQNENEIITPYNSKTKISLADKNLLTNNKYDNTKNIINEIKDEDEDDDEDNDDYDISNRNTINPKTQKVNSFNLNSFIDDFSSLGKFFWDSSLNYEIEGNFEADYLNLDVNENDTEEIKKKSNEIRNEIFSGDDFFNKNKISYDKIIKYVKYVFGCGNANEQYEGELKMIMKIFFISYISNEIIDYFCIKVNKKGFRYKSICQFYYNVLKSFNDAINGFKEIGKTIIEEKEKLKEFRDLKNQEVGEKPSTILYEKRKD